MLAHDHFIGLRFEKCRVERLIGRGGYGLTYLAFDEELLESRVIKICQVGIAEGADFDSRLKPFIDEGLILSRLKHPQIVTLRGQGELYGHRYMILDYIHGHSLKSILDLTETHRREPGRKWEDLLDPAAAAALILSSLRPLAYAHAANVHLPDREIFGVAHRDIAPGNLMLGAKGNEKDRVVLIDFGTAKTRLQDSVTVNQNLIGTVPYMSKARLQKAASPERGDRHREFWRSFRETRHDVHSMGVLFFQLLTGRLPFSGDTAPQVIVQILDRESYLRCFQAAEARHPGAARIIRRSVVHYDFELPIEEQEYQYPDAVAMLSEVEALFATEFGGTDAEECLRVLNEKLAGRPAPVSAPVRPAPPATAPVQAPSPPEPVPYLEKLADGQRSMSSSLIGIVAFLGLVVVALSAVFFHIRSNQFRKIRLEQSRMQLEKIEPDPSPADQPAGPLRPDASPVHRPAAPRAPKPAASRPARATARPAASRPAPGAAKPSPSVPARAAAKSAPSVPARPTAKSALSGREPAAPAPASGRKPMGETRMAVEAADASGDASGGPKAASPASRQLALDKGAFFEAQTLVRVEDPEAGDKVAYLLSRHPGTPDLLFLHSRVLMRKNPASREARAILAGLQGRRPEHIHPEVFQENVLYLLWRLDQEIFARTRAPKDKISLIESSRLYLAKYRGNERFAEKVRRIESMLPN